MIQKLMNLLVLFVLFLLLSSKLFAQEKIKEIEGMIWYLDKKEAMDSARSQNKNILVLWGREYCGICNNVKHNIATEPVKSLVEKSYILWFFDFDKCPLYKYKETTCDSCSDVQGYFDPLLTSNIESLPYLCIISPKDTVIKSYGVSNGYKSVDYLVSLLEKNQSVANESIKNSVENSVQAFVYGMNLVIKSDSYNEMVSVYSLTGALVDKFVKTEQVVTRDASKYPTGLLVVYGSSGWNKKILKK